MSLAWRSCLMHRSAKPLVWLACALPAAWLLDAAFTDGLGPNPAEALQHATGLWSLRLLCLTLAVTPLRVHTNTPQLARFRRALGLATFAYAALHVLTYAVFDMAWDWGGMAADVFRRPFILVGTAAACLLLLLALTSFSRVARWLGGRRWKALHRSIYLIAGLALLHFFWMRAGKNNFAEVWPYAAVVAVLLLDRVARRLLHGWRTAATQRLRATCVRP